MNGFRGIYSLTAFTTDVKSIQINLFAGVVSHHRDSDQLHLRPSHARGLRPAACTSRRLGDGYGFILRNRASD